MTLDHKSLINQIRDIITNSRSIATRSINVLQVVSNYLIGKQIVEYEQGGSDRAQYGSEILSQLSEELSREFGRGYSQTNLKLMRQFFLTYRDNKSQTPSDQLVECSNMLSANSLQVIQNLSGYFSLSWSHYVFLIAIKQEDVRSFYEIESINGNWSLRELKRQFNSGLYERLALSRDKEGIKALAKEGQIVTEPKDVIKNPYVLEFLGIDEKEKYSESDLETAIIDKIEQFLLELGKGFLFETRQKRITLEEDHYFVDLVFYNRLLRCYTLIDLKIGELTHQDLGQLQMYVNYYDRYMKLDDENSTIGIILCRKNKESLVEITLPEKSNIHASEYELYLPSKEQLQKQLDQVQHDWDSLNEK